MNTVYTNCRICLANCGIEVTVGDDNRVTRVAPDKQNPYTWRDFCAKARTAPQSVEHPRRLRAPMRRVGDRYVAASWEEAISEIADRLRAIRDKHGPDAIGMYLGNPAYFAAANPLFATGFLDGVGTRNRYSALSVDTNSLHVVAEALYGSPLFALVPDVDESRCFLLVGMNPAVSAMGWVTNVPNGWRRILAAQAKGADLIVVDPRRTPTAEKADTHLAVRPGQDWALLLGNATTFSPSPPSCRSGRSCSTPPGPWRLPPTSGRRGSSSRTWRWPCGCRCSAGRVSTGSST